MDSTKTLAEAAAVKTTSTVTACDTTSGPANDDQCPASSPGQQTPDSHPTLASLHGLSNTQTRITHHPHSHPHPHAHHPRQPQHRSQHDLHLQLQQHHEQPLLRQHQQQQQQQRPQLNESHNKSHRYSPYITHPESRGRPNLATHQNIDIDSIEENEQNFSSDDETQHDSHHSSYEDHNVEDGHMYETNRDPPSGLRDVPCSRSKVPEERRRRNNSLERQRVHNLNSALDSLRQVIPYSYGPSEKKLSKMSTLLLARNYIVELSRSLEEMRRLVQELTLTQRPPAPSPISLSKTASPTRPPAPSTISLPKTAPPTRPPAPSPISLPKTAPSTRTPAPSPISLPKTAPSTRTPAPSPISLPKTAPPPTRTPAPLVPPGPPPSQGLTASLPSPSPLPSDPAVYGTLLPSYSSIPGSLFIPPTFFPSTAMLLSSSPLHHYHHLQSLHGVLNCLCLQCKKQRDLTTSS